jgi:hypothetical protein
MQRFYPESHPVHMKQMFLLAIAILICNTCFTQTYFDVFTGYQTDLNNRNYHFNMINSGVQLRLKKNWHYEMILQLQKSWGVATNSSTAAFTIDPALPLQSAAHRTITPSFASFSLGNKFVITRKHFPGSIGFLVYGGFCYQQLKVKYNSDKINYTVLNPDRTQEGGGIFFSVGMEYLKEIKNGRIFFQVLASPQPLMNHVGKDVSFNFMAPLSFNAGYSFMIQNKK